MHLHLLINELKLQYYEIRQYWFETVSGLILVLLVFVGLFYGIKGFVVEQGDNQSLDGLVFGFILWNFASGAYGSATKTLIEDNQKGYLEQLFLCPQGFVSLILHRSITDNLTSVVIVTIIAYLAMALTNNWLDINFPIMYGILFLAAPSLVGFGLIMCGLALLFKRVETIGAFLTIGLMGLVALDGIPFNVFTLLPFVPGVSMAREVVLNQSPFVWTHLWMVVANSTVYLIVGIVTFRFFERKAKQRNLIGQY